MKVPVPVKAALREAINTRKANLRKRLRAAKLLDAADKALEKAQHAQSKALDEYNIVCSTNEQSNIAVTRLVIAAANETGFPPAEAIQLLTSHGKSK